MEQAEAAGYLGDAAHLHQQQRRGEPGGNNRDEKVRSDEVRDTDGDHGDREPELSEPPYHLRRADWLFDGVSGRMANEPLDRGDELPDDPDAIHAAMAKTRAALT